MNIQSSRVMSTMPAWARDTVAAAKSPCQGGECIREENEYLSNHIRGDIADVMHIAAMDEVPGQDLDLGQPGRVTSSGTTTNFEQKDGYLEFSQTPTEQRATQNWIYGHLLADSSYTYVAMSHKEGVGTRYDGALAGPGAFRGEHEDCTRPTGFLPLTR